VSDKRTYAFSDFVRRTMRIFPEDGEFIVNHLQKWVCYEIPLQSPKKSMLVEAVGLNIKDRDVANGSAIIHLINILTGERDKMYVIGSDIVSEKEYKEYNTKHNIRLLITA
jgi:hypothetical protein